MKKNGNQSWEVLSDTEVFVKKPWVRVSRQSVRLPNGKVIDDYTRIAIRDYVVIFAQTPDGDVITEKQYKHGVGRHIINLPTGYIEDGETPLQSALRELMEETGYIADSWRVLGNFTLHLNYGCGTAYLISAGNAKNVRQPESGDLEEAEVCLTSLAELIASASTGDFQGLESIATLAIATNPLFRSQG